MKEWLWKRFFGDDVFISYSRIDGATYAAGLAGALAARRLSCRFDQWGAPPGKEIPEDLLKPLRRSAMLVVVGTAAAGRSPHVEREIREFLKTQRLIVPIDVDGTLQSAEWWPMIAGLAFSSERKSALRTEPSQEVIDRIINCINFTSRNRRLQRYTGAAASTFLLLAGAAVVAGRRAAANRREANRQQELATIRRLANDSEFVLRERSDSVVQSVTLAVEAAGRSEALNLRVLEADSALRNSLALLPRSRGVTQFDDQISSDHWMRSSVAISPDGRHVALLCEKGVPHAQLLIIRQVADGQEIFNQHCDRYNGIAVSSEPHRIALCKQQIGEATIRIIDLQGEESSISIPSPCVFAMALSHDGKLLAVVLWDLYDRMRVDGGDVRGTTAELWNVESKQRIAQLDLPGLYQANSIAFAAHEYRLAIGGLEFANRGNLVGHTLVWDVRQSDPGTPEELPQPAIVGKVAVSKRYVVTSLDRTALVWRRADASRFEQVARLALESEIVSLGISADGSRFLTFCSSGKCERWDITGYREETCSCSNECGFPITDDNGFRLPGDMPADIPEFKPVDFFAVSKDGNLLAAIMQAPDIYDDVGSYAVKVWNIPEKIEVASVKPEARVAACRFSSWTNYLVIGDEQGSVLVVDFRTGDVRAARQYAPISAIAFSADEQYLATGDRTGIVVVSTIHSLSPIAHLRHVGMIGQIEFSPDGKHIATKTEVERFSVPKDENPFHVWSLETSELLRNATERLDRFATRDLQGPSSS